METEKALDSASPPGNGEGGGGTPPGGDPLVGRVVGDRWRVVRAIGRGGMGVVYEGQNVSIGKRVALKFIDAQFASDPEVVSRFQREAEAASAVESAHIVEVFDTGRTPEGQPYLVMELLRGESLGARVRRLGTLPPAEVAHIAAQSLRGLARAHAAGVIHRDLKPDNVFLVDRDDDPLFAKILDFGISKMLPRGADLGGGTLTQKGTVLGTPFYMSPEQAQAQADLDERTDLFSMGAILFECLTGKPPHAGLGTYEAVIVAICTRDVEDVRATNPTVSRELALVVKKALARDRSARFATAADFLAALRLAMPSVISAREGVPSHPTPTPAAPTDGTAPPTRTSWTAKNLAQSPSVAPPSSRAPRGRLALVGALAAAIAFVGTLVYLRAQSAPAAPPKVATHDPSVSDVSLRLLVTPPDARITIDGAPRPDGVVRGPALSAHGVHVEAEGYAPLDRNVVLDGRAELALELAPSIAPASASSAPKAGKPAASVAKKGAATAPPQPPPVPPTTGGGLKLKEAP